MDRKFSDGTVWDNSIDYDDAPDGSEGGYTKHGNYICAPAMTEIIELRKKSESQQALIEALEKDFAYHSELCTIQQARIGALREALKLINDRAGHGLGVSDVWLVAVTGKALQPEQEGEL